MSLKIDLYDFSHRYADYGTMLEIRDIEYTPDGRSIVNTIGSRRFKIVSKGARDGYNTAAVEFLQVNPLGFVSENYITKYTGQRRGMYWRR